MMDVIDQFLIGEQNIQAFQKSASTAIYGNYLTLNTGLETASFCNLSDTYNFSQTLRIIKY